MPRPKKPIKLTTEQKELLEKISRSRENSHSLVQRAEIILKAASGVNNKTISQKLGVCEETVGMWRKRWIAASQEFEQCAGKESLIKAVEKLLKDKHRPGSPGKFEAEQLCQIIALACEKPPDYLSHWTRKELKREIINRGIAEEISETTIGVFLKSRRFKTTSA
jgi:putative transposase